MPLLGSGKKEFQTSVGIKSVDLLPENSEINRQLNKTISTIVDSFFNTNPVTTPNVNNTFDNPSYRGLITTSYPLQIGERVGSLDFLSYGMRVYANDSLYTIITPMGLSAIGGTILGSNIFGGTVTGAYIFGSSISGTTISGGTVYGGSIIGGSISGASISGGSIYIGTPVNAVFPFQVNSFGSFTSSSGNIAGWTIGASGLSSGTTFLNSAGPVRFQAGTKFIVDSSGNLTANNVALSGSITAFSGLIGGWSITPNYISSVDDRVKLIQENFGAYASVSAINIGSFYTGGNRPTIRIVGDSTNEMIDMYYNSNSDWGIKGKNAGTTVFSLGSSNSIAGWTFDPNQINSVSDRIIIAHKNLSLSSGSSRLLIGGWNSTSTQKRVIIYGSTLATDSYVGMYYDGASQWGLQGVDSAGSEVFHLGSSSIIGGWKFNPSTLSSNNIVINSAGKIDVGDVSTNDYITVDGVQKYIQSSNFSSSNLVPKGFRLSTDGTLQAVDGYFRGKLSTNVFEKNKVNIVGGNLAFTSGAKMSSTASNVASASALTVEGNDELAVGDVIKIGTNSELLRVVNVSGTGSISAHRGVLGTTMASITSKDIAYVVGKWGLGFGFMEIQGQNQILKVISTSANGSTLDQTTQLELGKLTTGLFSGSYGLYAKGNIEIEGVIKANSGYFSGAITSSSGYIGGWNINNEYLSTTGGSVYLGSISALNSSTTYGLNNRIQNPTFESGTGNYVYSSTGTNSLTAYSYLNEDDGLGYQLNIDTTVDGASELDIKFYQALTGSYNLNEVVSFNVDYLDRTVLGAYYDIYIELSLINNSTVITSYTADLQSTRGVYDFSTFGFTSVLPSTYAGLTAQVRTHYINAGYPGDPYNYSFKNVTLTRVSSPISYYTDKGFHIYNETSELKYSSMGLIINNNNPSYLYTVSSENTYTNHITTTTGIITKRLPTLTFTDTTPSGSLISSNYGLGKLDYYNYNISQKSLAYIQTKLVNRLTSPSIERKTKFDFYTVTGGTTDTAPAWQLSVGDYTLSGVNAKFNGSVCANNIYLGTSHSISSNNEVVNLKTRSEILYNYIGDISRGVGGTLTSVSQFTSISSGYGMVRSGRISGYSLSYYLTTAPDTGTSNVGVRIYKNGTLQSSTTANITNSATYPLQYSLTGTLTSSINFVANDVINAHFTLLGSHTVGTCTITNPASIIEVLI